MGEVRLCHRWNLLSYLFILLLFQDSCSIAGAQDYDFLTITVHPAMFGKRWTQVVEFLALVVIQDNLCDYYQEHENKSVSDAANEWNLSEEDLASIALVVDPTVYDLKDFEICSYSDIARGAELWLPGVQYLLIPDENLIPMGKPTNDPDTSFFLATITYHDMEVLWGSGDNSTFVPQTYYLPDGDDEFAIPLVHLDAISRSILDICKTCSEDVFLGEIVVTWMRILIGVAVLSILGSLTILCYLAGTKARRQTYMKSVLNRLVVMVCLFDLMSSISMALATTPSPKSPPGDSPDYYYSQERWDLFYPSAMGNPTTCTAQGFFIEVGQLGSTLFTTFISIQVLVMVRYNKNEAHQRNIEKFYYSMGIGLPLIAATVLAALDLFHPDELGFCWINGSPPECTPVYTPEGGPILDAYCNEVFRGNNFESFQIIFIMGSVIPALVVMIAATVSVLLSIKNRRNSPEVESQRSELKKGLLYTAAFMLLWIPIFAAGETLASITIAVILVPLQGFFNFLIFSGVVEWIIAKFCCCCCTNSRDSPPALQQGDITEATKTLPA